MGVLRSRCAVCGSRIESRSARREGRLWFCSQSCFLEHESRPRRRAGAVPRGPLRALWRTVRWVLGAFVVLCVALVVAAILGAGKTGHSSSKSSQYDRSNPVPLRHAAVIGGGWRFKVLAVRRNANRQVLAVRNYGYAVNYPPPPRAHGFMGLLALTIAGG